MLPRRIQVAAVLWVLLLAVFSLRAAGERPQAPPPPAPVQPIPYSHKQHVAMGLQCRGCHVNPDAGKLMTYPATSTCMACHATVAADRPSIKNLASFAAEGKPVPWV